MSESLEDKVRAKYPRASKSFLAQFRTAAPEPSVPPAEGKRIRQKAAPKLNRLELEYLSIIKGMPFRDPEIYGQEVKLWLGNGLTYTPDFLVNHEVGTTVYEVKGDYAFEGSLDKLKMAAHKYRHWKFFLVWKAKMSKEWQQQRVLP